MDKARKIIIFSLTRTGCIEYTTELLRAFQPHNPIVFVNKTVAHQYQYDVKTIKTYSGLISFLYSSAFFFFNIKKIIQGIKTEYKAVTIYLPSFHFWNYFIARQARKEGIPCFVTVHDYKTHIGERSRTVEWVQKLTMSLATNLVFLSQSETDKAVKGKFNNNKIFHLPHPNFDVESINKLPHNNKPNILFIGRLKEYKGFNLLIDSIKDLDIEKLTIAGQGKTPLKSNGKIKIINGYINDDKLEYLLDTHEILVLPYLEATQSGVLSLGFSKNMVMVVSDQPGLREQISDKSCLWIEPNSTALKNAIQKLIKNEELYINIKKNSKLEKTEFEKKWNDTFNRLIKLISSNPNIN